MNNELNLNVLTFSRRTMTEEALGGLILSRKTAGGFDQESKDALAGVGLTSLEIRLIEESNAVMGDYLVPISINDLNIDNPWKKETLNLTRQIEITKNDPALAERLKRAA